MRNDNDIDKKLQELFGYDDESLLAEMKEAERASKAEKDSLPESATSTQREANKGFEQLMAKIREKGIQPISEEEYNERKTNPKIIKFSRNKSKE